MESNYEFNVSIDYRDYPKDKVYIVKYTDFPNVIGAGDTIEEAIKEAQGNLEAYFDYCKEKNSLVVQKAQMFDYLMQFVKNIDNEREIHYISFNNDTPWLDCIKIDKEHYEKIKELKEV